MNRIALLCVFTATILLIGSVEVASAHTAAITADCNEVIVNFTSFPSGANSATIDIDGATTTVNWTDSSHSETVAHTSHEGDAPFTVTVTWTVDGGGQRQETFQPQGCAEVGGIETPRAGPPPDLPPPAEPVLAVPQTAG